MEDPRTIALNAVLLFVVLFYVYPLKFVFTLALNGKDMAQRYGAHLIQDTNLPTLMMIYAIGFATVFLVFLLQYSNVYRSRHELQLTALEQHETITSVWENAAMTLVGLCAALLAAILPSSRQGTGTIIYLTIPIWMRLIRSVRRRRRPNYLVRESLATAGVAELQEATESSSQARTTLEFLRSFEPGAACG